MLDLDFGKCRLQVQVPENGPIQDPEDLIGKNVVTSFTGLTEQYFAKLEMHTPEEGSSNGEGSPRRRKLRTKIKYVGGSVEAACALGVADGIVDLVGGSSPIHPYPLLDSDLSLRIGRNNESCRSQGY